MIDTQSFAHLSCLIEGIALVKHSENRSRQDLKTLLESQGYDAAIAANTAEALSEQLQLAS